jgi:hypothetical protein
MLAVVVSRSRNVVVDGWSAEMFWEEGCGEWEEVYIP